MKLIHLLLPTLLCLSASVPAAVLEAPGAVAGQYRNPVLAEAAGADPAVLHHEGVYYAYTTNSSGAVYISTDLVNWEQGPQVIPDPLKGAWAPEVYHHPEDGRFYMYYTYRYKIGVAVADRPDGLFTNLGFIAIPGIDAHPFRDDDGRLYLYFSHTPAFSIYCIPMKSPVEPAGPATLCVEISQDWEKHDHAINEGPWIIKHDGIYHLFYSGSNGQTVHYSIGYATAPTPLGPFTKFAGNPVIARTETIHGPGHGSFTMDRNGQWWHLYHQKTSTRKGWQRFICLDPLDIDPQTGRMGSLPTKGEWRPAPALGPDLVWCPEFHPRGAVFRDCQAVALSSRTPGAVIRYTTDGSAPTAESPVYTGPFAVTRSVTVQARAFKEGMRPSPAARMNFTRSDAALPALHLTDGPSGDPPFEVYPAPRLDIPLIKPAADGS